jgi:hypothetical protein
MNWLLWIKLTSGFVGGVVYLCLVILIPCALTEELGKRINPNLAGLIGFVLAIALFFLPFGMLA